MKYLKNIQLGYLFLSLFGIVILYSCNESNPLESQDPGLVVIDGKLKTNTRVNSTGSATSSDFENGDVIAVSKGGEFVKYSRQENTWKSEGNPLKWDRDEMVFEGFYPVKEGTSMSTFTLPTDQSDLLKISNAEYLLAEAVSAKRGKPVVLTFSRQVSRIILNITFIGEHNQDTTIHSVHIASPASEVLYSAPVPGVVMVTSYQKTNLNFYAIILPTADPQPDETFISIETTGKRGFALTGIPALEEGKSYSYNIRVLGDGSTELEVGDIIVNDWGSKHELETVEGYRVMVNEKELGMYSPGETVRIKAPFIHEKKFVEWSLPTGSILPENFNKKSATTTFIMPASIVELTPLYEAATAKVEILKPGIITNSRDGQIDSALIFDTGNSYVRYYKQGDEVRFSAPATSETTRTSFDAWSVREGYGNISFWINQGGGARQADSWFLIRSYSMTPGSVLAKLEPLYEPKPYWHTIRSAKGWINAHLIEEENKNDSSLPTIPTYRPFYRALTPEEKRVVKRAIDAVELTFAIPPRRALNINFAVTNAPGEGFSAAARPVIADHRDGYEAPKKRWEKSDFDGRAAGRPAISSKVEAVWRDQINIVPDSPKNGYIGQGDGTIVINHAETIGRWYYGDDPNAKPQMLVDAQSVITHELGHLICYHSLNAKPGTTQFTALDVFVAHKSDPANINVLNGNMFSTDGGEGIIYNEAVKKALGGRYLEVETGMDNAFDFGHLAMMDGVIGVGSIYHPNSAITRRFSDFELVFLQEMGWKINPDAWLVAP